MIPKKIIGILGGMGPAATATFFNDVVSVAQKEYGAEQDPEFPVVYLYNAPLDGFNETGFADMDLVKKQLVADVQKIESWGADFIVIPCNTVHHFIEDMRNAIKIPIISIIETAVLNVKKSGYKKVGIVSSTSTRLLGLYEKALSSGGHETVLANDDEQKFLDGVILSVMSGKQGQTEKEGMKNIIERMKKEGAEAVILGCTELPLAIEQRDTDVPILNTIHLLAQEAVKESFL